MTGKDLPKKKKKIHSFEFHVFSFIKIIVQSLKVAIHFKLIDTWLNLYLPGKTGAIQGWHICLIHRAVNIDMPIANVFNLQVLYMTGNYYFPPRSATNPRHSSTIFLSMKSKSSMIFFRADRK